MVRHQATMRDLCSELDGVSVRVNACPHDAAHRMAGRDLRGLVQIGAPPR